MLHSISNPLCSASGFQEVSILSIPFISPISQNNDTLSVNSNGQVLWFLEDELINNVPTDFIVISENGNYSAKASLENCESAWVSDSFVLNSVDVLVAEVLFYPNPMSDKLFFTTSQTGKFKISIFDASGKKWMDSTITGDNSAIDCTRLSDGIYYLSGQNDKVEIVLSKSFVVVR